MTGTSEWRRPLKWVNVHISKHLPNILLLMRNAGNLVCPLEPDQRAMCVPDDPSVCVLSIRCIGLGDPEHWHTWANVPSSLHSGMKMDSWGIFASSRAWLLSMRHFDWPESETHTHTRLGLGFHTSYKTFMFKNMMSVSLENICTTLDVITKSSNFQYSRKEMPHIRWLNNVSVEHG